MSNIKSKELAYSTDVYGKPLNAQINWSNEVFEGARPIALIFHAGGLLVGSYKIVPRPQVEHLCSLGFVVVIPNYRLAPQATAKEIYKDSEVAYDWATTDLVHALKADDELALDPSRVVALGHSSGGTLSMHLATKRPLKAVTAFYPSVLLSDVTTSSHQPTTAPPFGLFPDFTPTEEDWALIKPADHQISEAPLGGPGAPPPPRNKWQMSLIKNGQWLSTVQPDGDYAALDPIVHATARFPPTLIVAGEADNIPGSELALQERAVAALREADAEDVKLILVPEATHMFDLPPTVGTVDQGPKWQAVLEGLAWLRNHIS